MDRKRKEIEKFWDRTAGSYDASEKQFKFIHTKAVEHTKKYLQVSDTVLDYGCGTGKKTIELAKFVKKIHAIDVSGKMIEIAKGKFANSTIENVDFAQATLFDSGYEHGSFDVIMAYHILHVVDDNRNALKKISQLLKPGGLFISITPCLEEKMVLFDRVKLTLYLLLIKFGIVPDMLTSFTFPELEHLIQSENLELVATEKMFHRVSNLFIVARKKENRSGDRNQE